MHAEEFPGSETLLLSGHANLFVGYDIVAAWLTLP